MTSPLASSRPVFALVEFRHAFTADPKPPDQSQHRQANAEQVRAKRRCALVTGGISAAAPGFYSVIIDHDRELRTVVGGKDRLVVLLSRHGTVANNTCIAEVICFEQVWSDRVAAAVALAFVVDHSDPHPNTTGRLRGPRI